MKKFFFAAILAALFSFVSSNEAVAQQSLGNRTGCEMIIKYAYGPIGSCTIAGYHQETLAPYSAIPAPMPAGMDIKMAKGTYTTGGCNAFYVGYPACSSYTFNDAVSCTSACGDFKAIYDPNWGVVAYH